jgi:hypothetical protein
MNEHIGRAREQEAPWHGMAIDLPLERGEQRGGGLDLVNHRQAGGVFDERRKSLES